MPQRDATTEPLPRVASWFLAVVLGGVECDRHLHGDVPTAREELGRPRVGLTAVRMPRADHLQSHRGGPVEHGCVTVGPGAAAVLAVAVEQVQVTRDQQPGLTVLIEQYGKVRKQPMSRAVSSAQPVAAGRVLRGRMPRHHRAQQLVIEGELGGGERPGAADGQPRPGRP